MFSYAFCLCTLCIKLVLDGSFFFISVHAPFVCFCFFCLAPSAVKQIAPLGQMKGLSHRSHVITLAKSFISSFLSTKTTVSVSAHI